jgi:hypothetical protein
LEEDESSKGQVSISVFSSSGGKSAYSFDGHAFSITAPPSLDLEKSFFVHTKHWNWGFCVQCIYYLSTYP